MVEKIKSDLFRIEVPLPDSPLRSLNSYVILGEPRNILMDTGYRRPECWEALKAGIDELKLDMSKTDILLTHLHADHTGLAVDAASSESRIYIGRGDMPWLLRDEKSRAKTQDEGYFSRLGFPEDFIRSNHNSNVWDWTAKDYSDYIPIDDGDTFTVGRYCLRAIETTGHTPAHMCFWDEGQKIMFTGDHVLFDITPNITSWMPLRDTLGSYLESLREIDKYDPVLALPGHRQPGDFHARIRKLLSHHEKRLNECVEIVRENPGLSTYDIAGLMRWHIRSDSWESFPSEQKWFAVGEAFSHLHHLYVLGRIRKDKTEPAVRFYPI
jgi:glyoxylase-like metal-dependent hydrolase (beta-lactamase superfamily II)